MHREVPYISGSYLVLELTNHCNLACVHCAVYEDQSSEKGHPHYATKGYLHLNILEELIEDWVMMGVRFDALILFWLGEPLLHPEFELIYQKLLRVSLAYQVFKKIEVHSNSVLLNEKRRDVLLNSAALPQVFHCSLDANSPETYQQIKGRALYAQAKHNVQQFLLEKWRKKARYPRIVLQFIVGSNNAHEVERFRDDWQTWARENGGDLACVAGQVPSGEEDCIFYRQLDCPDQETQLQENQVFRESMRTIDINCPEPAAEADFQQENLTPCSGFWKSPVIDWTGEVTVCTRDNELKNCLGSLENKRFSALWWGEQSWKNREKVGRGCYEDLPLCQTCFIPQSLNHSGITAEEISLYAEGND